jgi:hypothetical protein
MIIAINTWFFPVSNGMIAATAILIFALFTRSAVNKNVDTRSKIIWMSFAAMAFSYFLLNFNFYPKLLPYQSGHGLAKKIKEKKIDPKRIYYLQGGEKNYSMEFSLHTLVPVVIRDSIKNLPGPVYLFAGKEDVDTLNKNNFLFDTLIQVNHHNVSAIKYKFLNPSTRGKTFSPQYVLLVK